MALILNLPIFFLMVAILFVTMETVVWQKKFNILSTQQDPFYSLGRINALGKQIKKSYQPAMSQGNKILGLIMRNVTYKEKKLIIPLFKATVRPHLEYCIQAWRPYRKKDY